MNLVETFKVGDNTVEIFYDEDPPDPRDNDNLGKMVCLHSRYRLGDQHTMTLDEAMAFEKRKDIICLPLYLYDHSGLRMRTTDFGDRWDSGKVGFIFITLEDARKEMMVKRITRKVHEKIIKSLISEVEEYDMFLSNDVYGFTVTNAAGEKLDSMWGIYGLDYAREEATNAAK